MKTKCYPFWNSLRCLFSFLFCVFDFLFVFAFVSEFAIVSLERPTRDLFGVEGLNSPIPTTAPFYENELNSQAVHSKHVRHSFACVRLIIALDSQIHIKNCVLTSSANCNLICEFLTCFVIK